VQKYLGICVILALLTATLESAATFGDLGPGSGAALQNDPAEAPVGESLVNEDDDCATCTPSCYCGCHGGVAVANWLHFEQAPPETLTPRAETRYLSLTNPPSLPPPIPGSPLA